jgi:diaminopimelate decarboxylase
MYGSNHYIENISNPDDSERFYSIVGYICETDTFATNRRISMISEGDILCFKNAGAYCFSMASNYNSRYKPSEILFYKNEFTEIRKRESFEDLIKNQIEIDF